MMRLIVQKRFRDKFNRTVRYQPGEMVEFDAERAADLIERGLAAAIDRLGGHTDEPGKLGKLGDPGEPGKEPEAEKEPEADKEPAKEVKKATKQKAK